jgi:hypothetical protein
MPARDSIHAAVVNALVKDEWEITDDPLYLEFGNRHVFIDLGAEDSALVSLEREGVRIAIEFKTLAGPSSMLALEHAVGQFVLYNLMLEEEDSGRQLYLAVPDSTTQRCSRSRWGPSSWNDCPSRSSSSTEFVKRLSNGHPLLYRRSEAHRA